MTNVLEWVKSNVFIVIFSLVIIAAPVSMFILSGGMNKAVKEKVEERAKLKGQLESLNKTQVTLTGANGQPESHSVLVNQQLLDAYEARAQAEGEDAKRVVDLALQRNRGEHGVLMSQLFPKYDKTQYSYLWIDFQKEMLAAYDQLIEEVGGGTPPTDDEIRDEIERTRAQFMETTANVAEESELSEEERQELRTRLVAQRLRRYEDAAAGIGLYVTAAQLDRPGFTETSPPSILDLYEHQWRYWIQSDVLRALAEANAQETSVTKSPVKRVISLWIDDAARVAAQSGGGGGGGGMGFGLGSGGGDKKPAGNAPATGVPANPAMPVALDYKMSFTGRVTNPLYDVRIVYLDMVVDTPSLPQVLNALAKQNFITVLDVDVTLREPQEDLADGYLYGSGTLSEVSMVLETVWIRDWTKTFMPDEVRTALGIPLDTPPPPAVDS